MGTRQLSQEGRVSVLNTSVLHKSSHELTTKHKPSFSNHWPKTAGCWASEKMEEKEMTQSSRASGMSPPRFGSSLDLNRGGQRGTAQRTRKGLSHLSGRVSSCCCSQSALILLLSSHFKYVTRALKPFWKIKELKSQLHLRDGLLPVFTALFKST